MNNQIYGLTTGQASPTTMKEVRAEPASRNGPLVGQPLGLSKETFDELMGEFM